MTYNLYDFAIWYRLYGLYNAKDLTISNKEKLTPHEYRSEPEWEPWGAWHKGYSFKHFWSNCYFLLGEIAKLEGIQQLCHQYYLQNGSLNAVSTVHRIKRFLAITD